ncbi:MAG: biotin--[acetyl-CoA-carboxylase] ligase [Chloroflexota bacterium]|nr:biotin--[acetyl-CoA-carboxylase] ligase [Chloroflexota bacterium]
MLASVEPFPNVARAGRRIGHRVEWHPSIGSTNDRARALLDEPDGAGTAVVADEQLAGRGRRGRTWASPPGVNLMVSVGFRPHLAAADAWMLGQAVALAARSACMADAEIGLKWPNDLVSVDGRKLAGVLVETAMHDAELTAAVVGIGINVNWRVADMPSELTTSATSLAELSGHEVDRRALLDRLLTELDAEIVAIESGTSPLERYRAACTTVGQRVTVEIGTRSLVGLATGLDAHGGLVLETDEGRLTVTSGEVVRTRPELSR